MEWFLDYPLLIVPDIKSDKRPLELITDERECGGYISYV